MKSQVTRILSIGIVLVAVAAVQAQEKTVTANVPFSFYMGASAMAQGAYNVNELSHGTVVCLRSKEAAKTVTTYEISGNKKTEPGRLVFHRYGNTYFLAEIWTGDTSIGEGLSMSAREKELAQHGSSKALAEIRLALPR